MRKAASVEFDAFLPRRSSAAAVSSTARDRARKMASVVKFHLAKSAAHTPASMTQY